MAKRMLVNWEIGQKKKEKENTSKYKETKGRYHR